MLKRILPLTYFLLLSTSLAAMDLNETKIIINEATQATEGLQDKFTLLENEIVSPIKKEIPELNVSKEETVMMIDITEMNKTTEINSSFNTQDLNITKMLSHQQKNKSHFSEINDTMEINSSFNTQDLNTSKELSCEEHNTSTLSPQVNNALADNDCSDTVIEGSTIRGFIIFKTRIKPLCEMNGEAFAKQYMQEDWDDIFHEKEFKMEVIKACPRIEKRYQEKWTPHLYQFTLEYASDSDAIPEC